jgi:amino acid transporter
MAQNDVEKGSVYDKPDVPTPSYTTRGSGEPHYEQTTEIRQGYTRRVLDSFKRDPNLTVTPKGTVGANGRVFNPAGVTGGRVWNSDQAAIGTATSPLARKLKGRHLQMIAIGGSIGMRSLEILWSFIWLCIGTGLFVASGKALEAGGPASLLICFSLIGIMLYCTVHALGEMAVLFPVAGSFSAYSTRFLDPAWGFAMGWVRRGCTPQIKPLLTLLELCLAMACRSPLGDYRRLYYNQLLGSGAEIKSRYICHGISSGNHLD